MMRGIEPLGLQTREDEGLMSRVKPTLNTFLSVVRERCVDIHRWRTVIMGKNKFSTKCQTFLESVCNNTKIYFKKG